MDEKKFIGFAEEVIRLKDEIKGINSDIKEAVETFAEETGLNVKSVKKAVKAYEEYLKSKEEFVAVDMEVANVLNLVIYRDAPDA